MLSLASLFLIAIVSAAVNVNVPVKMNGIAYAPLRQNKWCVTREDIFEDVALLAQATTNIRTYTTGCNHIEHVIAACALNNLGLYVGLDVSANGKLK